MFAHPMIHPTGASPLMKAAPAVHPAAMGGPMRQPNPLAQQRAEVSLGLAKQRALAQALRGGGPPSPGFVPTPNRPAGIPQVR